jgi:hypothetical protein
MSNAKKQALANAADFDKIRTTALDAAAKLAHELQKEQGPPEWHGREVWEAYYRLWGGDVMFCGYLVVKPSLDEGDDLLPCHRPLAFVFSDAGTNAPAPAEAHRLACEIAADVNVLAVAPGGPWLNLTDTGTLDAKEPLPLWLMGMAFCRAEENQPSNPPIGDTWPLDAYCPRHLDALLRMREAMHRQQQRLERRTTKAKRAA